ncbi:hypothetical protein [Clostridium brassicae]|uniref:Uncharacterized protein n=1 Tax=Clostridium brassicae TaxID=2999072 RepID=A0ABT4D698_9CLOT|nr:hypothetical protein [Clostridium brassicae]MCY6957825.1 hypothetical protein [Clostridium brassicae]
MSIWDIKTKILLMTNKIALEQDFYKRMDLMDQVITLNDILTEKIAKQQENIKASKRLVLAGKIKNGQAIFY